MSNTINIDLIQIDGGTQSRVELNEAVVAEYAEAMIDSDLPPVTVFFDGSSYWLADGFHRYWAHRHHKMPEIAADVRQGTKRDAILYSVGSNAAHGLRRSNADKRKAVETLLQDAEWAQWSDRQIAKACGVSAPFVGALRKPEIAERQQQNRAASAAKKAAECNPITPSPANEMPGPDFGADSKVVSLQARRDAKAEQAPQQDDFEPNWLAELEEANAEIQRQQQLIDSLTKDDLAKELAGWQMRYSQLEGRLRQEMTTANEAEKQARYYGDVLKRLRRMVGVEKTSELVARVKQMMEVAS